MIDNLQLHELKIYKSRVLEIGEAGLKGIELIQAIQLKNFIQKEIDDHLTLCLQIAKANPDYEYPEEYKNNHYEFWKNDTINQLKQLKLILNTVKTFILFGGKEKEETTPPPPQKPKGYYINLTDQELKALYQKLVDANFLKPTNVEHFVNAFNGEKLDNFEPIKWKKSVYANLFVRITIADDDNPANKVWKRAEQLFNNGNANALKNAVKAEPIDKHKVYQKEITAIIKSLQTLTVK